MRISAVQNTKNYNNYNFKAKINKVPKTIFARLGVDMTTEVGYKGEPNYTPAPPEVGACFRKLGVDWSTRVDERSKKGGLFG